MVRFCSALMLLLVIAMANPATYLIEATDKVRRAVMRKDARGEGVQKERFHLRIF